MCKFIDIINLNIKINRLKNFKFNNDRFKDDNFVKIIKTFMYSTNNNLTGVEKSFFTELLYFYTSTNSFIQTEIEDLKNKKIDFFNTPDSIMIIYPTLRRLLEVCINYAYIFDTKNDRNTRYNEYKEFVDDEYFNLFETLGNDYIQNNNGIVLNKSKWPGFGKLPNPITGKNKKLKNSFFNHFMEIKNNKYQKKLDCYAYEQLYDCYKVLCFFTHGNINLELILDIYNNNNFCIISVFEFMNSLAEIYINILKNNFNNLYTLLKPYIT